MEASTNPQDERLMFIAVQVFESEKGEGKEEYWLFGGVFVHAGDLLQGTLRHMTQLAGTKIRFSAYGTYPLSEEQAKEIFLFPFGKREKGEKILMAKRRGRVSQEDLLSAKTFLREVANDWNEMVQMAGRNKSRVILFGLCRRPPRKPTTSVERRSEREGRVERYERIRERDLRGRY